VFDARSSTRQTAEADAISLTQAVDAATTMHVFDLKMRAFDAVHFRAEGEHVRADLHLLPEEISWLVAVAVGPG